MRRKNNGEYRRSKIKLKKKPRSLKRGPGRSSFEQHEDAEHDGSHPEDQRQIE